MAEGGRGKGGGHVEEPANERRIEDQRRPLGCVNAVELRVARIHSSHSARLHLADVIVIVAPAVPRVAQELLVFCSQG